MEHFSCQTRILAGNGILPALGEFHPRRLFLVTDPFFAKNGWAERVIQASGAEAWEIFDQVVPDPSVTLAAAGAARVREFQPDLMVALGGGSAMDCAKAMNYFGTNCPLAAIPTTSGSGSEVTDFAILTHGGVKHPLVDPRLRPDVAILDSDLLKELPPSLIADGGFDVLTHALEAYTAKNAGAITDALAEKAFCTAFRLLPHSYAGHRDARPGVHEAATMAGMAFTQAGLGLCHAMAHSIGGELHIPHGRLNAILLPAVMSRNATAAGSRYAAMARAIGLEGRADTVGVRNLRTALIRLRRELGLPATLSQAGVPSTQVRQKADRIVKAALADPCCATNPVTVTEGMVRDILHEVTGNG